MNSVPDLAVAPLSETATPEIPKQDEGREIENVENNKIDTVDHPNDGNLIEESKDVVSDEPGKFYTKGRVFF